MEPRPSRRRPANAHRPPVGLHGRLDARRLSAVGVVSGDLDAVDTLAALVAQSLVRIHETDSEEPRFRMLDAVRAYAAERLAERGEVDATVARLVGYLTHVVENVRDDLQGRRTAPRPPDLIRNATTSAPLSTGPSRSTTLIPSAGY